MGLPFLDCFLNSKGQAQTNGRPLPTRFNTFFWGCGLTASLWIPKTAGTDYDMTVQLKPLEPYRKKLNVFSGLRVPLDSKPNGQHWSGLAAAATGIAPFQTRRVRVQNDRPAGGRGDRQGCSLPVCGGVLQRRPQAELFQPGRSQFAPIGTHASVALHAPFRPRISGSDQGRLEARSANHAAEERAVRGGRRPQARDAEPGRQRPGPHGSVLHLRASNRTADGGGTPAPQHRSQGLDPRGSSGGFGGQ